MKPLIVGAAALVLLTAVPPRSTANVQPRSAADAAAIVDADGERIGRHLEAVERHLRAADVSHLGPDRRAARAAALDHLREYRERGVYPHNHDFPERTPYFVDPHGVHCAMAYLIARSGDEALVDRVAASANNAYVRDLAEDPALRDWLHRNGMTAAEAAMVQPAYGGWPTPEPEAGAGPLHENYAAIGTATLVADALAVYLVARGGRHQRAAAFGGVLAGTAGALLAATVMDRERSHEALAVANVAMGLTTVGFSLYPLLRGGRDEPVPDRTAGSGAALELAPAMIRGAGVQPRPGVRIALRF